MDNEGMLLADGFEAAFLGVIRPIGAGHKAIAVYDSAKCIQILMERDGMDEEEAEEFFEFNTAGAYVGDQTPVYLERCSLQDVYDSEEDS